MWDGERLYVHVRKCVQLPLHEKFTPGWGRSFILKDVPPSSMVAPSRPLEHVEILAYQPGHYVFALWRNITIIYWMQQANGTAVLRLQAVTAEVVQAHPEGFSNIHLVKEGAGVPDAEARRGFDAMMQRHPNALACVAIVLMGAGFWASALQSVITGLLMVAPRQFMLRFASRPLDLLGWFPREHEKRTGEVIDAPSLSQAIDHVLRVGATTTELNAAAGY
jgi:hypothetical protein